MYCYVHHDMMALGNLSFSFQVEASLYDVKGLTRNQNDII